MTNKEIIENLLVLGAYLNREYGKQFPQEYYDSISSAIERLSKPSLPDNLDEAAFNYAELCKYEDADKLLCAEHFKAGAEWMASRVQPEGDLEEEVKSYIKDNFTIMDEVAQIPEEDRMYSLGQDDMVAFAKHFYGLGKARKED